MNGSGIHMKTNIESTLIYISTHFRQPLAVKTLADIANMSEFHFHRVFKAQTDFTPQKYVERLRLEHAAHVMVLNPDIKKIQLAFESGFQSPSSFNRAFKKYFGRSPSNMLQTQQHTSEIPEQIRERLADYAPIDIRYVNGFHLWTHLTSPEPAKITDTIESCFSDHKDDLYGVYLDPPLHMPPEACRFLVGHQVGKNEKWNYEVEGGYYLRIVMQGGIQDNIDTILEQHQRLEQNGYRIKYPLGIERVKVSKNEVCDYLNSSREMFIPITR